MSNSNSDELPATHTTHPPPPPSLASLPDEISLRCLALVPRSYHLSLSWVSKHLRSLVLSPELNTLRSTLPKSSIHLCFEKDYSSYHWLTLRPNNDETTTTTEYQLVPNPTPFPSHPTYGSSTVPVGSKIFFLGGYREPSSDVWILDTRTGNMAQGPIMSVPRVERDAAVGVIDGKIYVIGGDGLSSDGFLHGEEEEETQVEVFDPKSETWELVGMENMRKAFFAYRCSASVERKVYMVDVKYTSVYNPRESEGERLVQMVSQRHEKGGRKDRLINDMAHCVCVVEGVLFAFFRRNGIMWFDTKLNVWRKLLGPDGKQLTSSFIYNEAAMAEQDGKLVVLYLDIIPPEGLGAENEADDTVTNSFQWMTMLVSLDRAGERICGTVDWSGIVATLPYSFRLLHCLAVSD